jgi:hypothetical protein
VCRGAARGRRHACRCRPARSASLSTAVGSITSGERGRSRARRRRARLRCRQQIEEWRTFVTARRPFVTYKVAVSLDGRVRVPGTRWVTGEDSRRLVHVLRAQSDAVAVGMGTVRWDNPRLDARDVPVVSSRAGSHSGVARCPTAPSSSCAQGRFARSSDTRRGRCPVAAPRRRADACRGVPGRRSRRQAAGLRRAAPLR